MFQHSPASEEDWGRGHPRQQMLPAQIQVQPNFALCHRHCSSQAGFLGFGQPAIT